MNADKIKTLPKWAQKMILNPPRSGDGFHDWLFKAARYLHAVAEEPEIAAHLEAAAVLCGRAVASHEIPDAIKNSRGCAHRKSNGAPWPKAAKHKKLGDLAETQTPWRMLADLERASPEEPPATATDALHQLFGDGEDDPLLALGMRADHTKTRRLSAWLKRKGSSAAGAHQLIVPSPMLEETGRNQGGKISKRCLDNTGPRKYLIVEFDGLGFEEQARRIGWLRALAPLTMVVHSVGKSMHAWFRAEGMEEDRTVGLPLFDFMRLAVALGADKALWTRCQYARLPNGLRDGDPEKRQRVLYFDGAAAMGEWDEERIAELAAKRFGAAFEWAGGDLGNAQKFAQRHGRDIRYCWGGLDSWMVWDGRRWAKDEDGAVLRLAHDHARKALREASDIADEETRKAAVKAALALGNAARINAMLECARALEGVAVRGDEMDADPWRFNCANGTINLKTGALRPHDRRNLISKLSPAAYRPEEYDSARAHPLWTAFQERILPDAEVRAYNQRWRGYCLTGSVREQCMRFNYGLGANGKSTEAGPVQEVLGDYAQRAPQCLFIRDPKAGAKEELRGEGARLKGVRWALASEPDEGALLNESRIKELTGGDRIVARHLYKELFEFAPTHKLEMLGNHKPTIRGADHGIWRRIHLVPYTETIAEKEKDPELEAKLKAERDDILAWMVVGCLEWQNKGLAPPAAIRDATREYRREEDVLGVFLEEGVVRLESPLIADEIDRAWLSGTEVYRAYTSWAEDSGVRFTLTRNKLYKKLRERGLRDRKISTGIAFADLALPAAEPAGWRNGYQQ